jgi:hypothetical protein
VIFFSSHFKFALGLQTTINMSFHLVPFSPPLWEKKLVDHQRVQVKEWNFIMCDEWASLRRNRVVVLRTTHLGYKEFLGEHIGNLSVIFGTKSNPLGTTKIKTKISPPPLPFWKKIGSLWHMSNCVIGYITILFVKLFNTIFDLG